MLERWVAFSSTALEGAEIPIRAIRGEEELNRLFHFRVHATLRDNNDARERAAKLLEQPATLRFMDDGVEVRTVHGIVSEIDAQYDLEHHYTHLHLTIVPRLWLMTQRFGAELFLDASIPEVLVRKLTALGLRADLDFALALTETYAKREIVVQYEESDYDFFARWCEHEGIVTYFEHRDGRDVLVLADDAPPYGQLRVPTLMSRSRREHPAAYDVKNTLRRLPGTTRVHDYNYRSPRLGLDRNLRVERHVVDGDWVEFGAHTKDPGETNRIATVRNEATAATYELVTGGSTELSMRAGATFMLSGDHLDDQELLVTRMEIEGAHDEEDGGASWDNRFVAIPKNTPFRPPRRTPRPKVAGLLNARVDGEIRGRYAELDPAGRYHIQLALDRSGKTDLSASHPVRMMQPHAGSYYGMHFPLRPGTEVLIGFVDGNPDRPVIVGTAPNPETSSPVVRGNQTQNVLRTGSNNEMVIEDEEHSLRIRMHTPRFATTFQMGSVEEPEEGALLTTQANVSHAARSSHNLAATRSTTLTDRTSHLTGDSTYWITGVRGMSEAAARGLDVPSSLDLARLGDNLAKLTRHPEEYTGLDDADDEARAVESHVGAGGLWSQIGDSVHAMTETATFDALRKMAEAADTVSSFARGRAQGAPVGAPQKPAFVAGSPVTSALFSRDTAFVFGDRLAALSAYDTASVTGRQHAELKSPNTVEMAGGERLYITSAGEADLSANTVRIVGGFYPAKEAPPLDNGTSIGVMSRADLRIVSVDDCILLCAQKNLIGSAHTGDIRWQADGTISMKSASIVGSTGSLTMNVGGEVLIDADGDITIKSAGNITLVAAGKVVVDAPMLEATGSASIAGSLSVGGTVTCAELDAGSAAP